MKTFADYLQEALMSEALGKGEVWGILDGKYVPCDEKTMKVLRGPRAGEVAQPANKNKLNPGEKWQKVGDEWVVVHNNKVVRGNKKYLGKTVKDGKVVEDEPVQQPKQRRWKSHSYVYNRNGGIIHDYNRAGVPGRWIWNSDGTEKEWDEPDE